MNLKNISIATLALTFSVSAFAKITMYTNFQATQKVLNSDAFEKAVKDTVGELSEISVQQRDDSNAYQAFVIQATILNKSPIGNLNCFIKADVFTMRDENAPAGVTSTILSEPVVSPRVCEK